MKFLRDLFDKHRSSFEKGGKFEKFFPLFEAKETFLFTPGSVSKKDSHVRDALDMKRLMMTVVVALFPAILFGIWNTGYQTNLSIEAAGLTAGQAGVAWDWHHLFFQWIGMAYDSSSLWSNVLLGAIYFIPIWIVTFAAGGFWEVLFAIIRRHEIAEGFLVTGMLFPLILPASIPLWQVALGISFGVVLGKEVFGGSGRNVFNPALMGRAFLFFAYPAQISGNAVWLGIDGMTKATPLADLAEKGISAMSGSWLDAFFGFIPGSIGETSTLAILFGALVLIISGIGSWRIMLSIFLGMFIFSGVLNFVGSQNNLMFAVPFYWHLVLGGFAFGTVFMATDPVSAAVTPIGQVIYGLIIGAMVILIRVINPAFPEGMMLAILFGNAVAPLIDHYVVRRNIKRRALRTRANHG